MVNRHEENGLHTIKVRCLPCGEENTVLYNPLDAGAMGKTDCAGCGVEIRGIGIPDPDNPLNLSQYMRGIWVL